MEVIKLPSLQQSFFSDHDNGQVNACIVVAAY